MKKTLTAFNTKVPTVIKAVGVLLLLTILVNPLYTFASSNPQIDIPFSLQDGANYNSWFYDNVSILESDSNVGPLLSDSDYVFVPIDLSYYGYWDDWSWWWISILALPIDDFDNPISDNLFTSPLYPDFVSGKNCYFFNLWIDDRGNYLSHVEDFQIYSYPNDRYIFGQHTSDNIADLYVYVSSYPVYWQKNVYSSNDTLILQFSNGGNIISGSSVAPSFETSGHSGNGVGGSQFLGNGADFGASISQAIMPSQPTINNYTWNTYTPPTVDTSTLETLLKSLIDIVKYNAAYITDGIKGTLETIIANIQAYGNYVGSIIAYVGRSIITNIQNGIQNLYENIVSLFEPILNGIMVVATNLLVILDNIIELGTESGVFSLTTLLVRIAVPSQEQFNTLVSDSDTFQLIGLSNTCYTKIQSELTTLRGLQSSKIIHVPSLIYHGKQIGDFDIEF